MFSTVAKTPEQLEQERMAMMQGRKPSVAQHAQMTPQAPSAMDQLKTTATNKLINDGVGGGIDYGYEKAGEGLSKLLAKSTAAPVPTTTQMTALQSAAPMASAPLAPAATMGVSPGAANAIMGTGTSAAANAAGMTGTQLASTTGAQLAGGAGAGVTGFGTSGQSSGGKYYFSGGGGGGNGNANSGNSAGAAGLGGAGDGLVPGDGTPGTNAGTSTVVDGLCHEGNVVSITVGIGLGHTGHRSRSILEDNRCVFNIFCNA